MKETDLLIFGYFTKAFVSSDGSCRFPSGSELDADTELTRSSAGIATPFPDFIRETGETDAGRKSEALLANDDCIEFSIQRHDDEIDDYDVEEEVEAIVWIGVRLPRTMQDLERLNDRMTRDVAMTKGLLSKCSEILEIPGDIKARLCFIEDDDSQVNYQSADYMYRHLLVFGYSAPVCDKCIENHIRRTITLMSTHQIYDAMTTSKVSYDVHDDESKVLFRLLTGVCNLRFGLEADCSWRRFWVGYKLNSKRPEFNIDNLFRFLDWMAGRPAPLMLCGKALGQDDKQPSLHSIREPDFYEDFCGCV